jgi:ubiquinone/menaquinone biosynthesis C-methylase UbiE
MSQWKHKRTVMQRYNLTASMYDVRYAEEQEAKYKAVLEGLSIIRGSVVLDVGCGTGLFFSHIANNAGVVVGVDISRGLLFQAKERIKLHPNLHVILADADNLPFKDADFGFVFVFTVLQNMPKPLVTLGEIKRISSNGSHIVIAGLKKAFSLEELGELMQSTGFVLMSLRDDEALRCFVIISKNCHK